MQKTLLAAVLACVLLGCQSPVRTPPESATGSAAWDAFVTRTIEARMAIQPTWGVQAGRHEFDGKLADYSRAGVQRRVEFLRASRDQALAFADTGLNPAQRFERDNLVAELEGDIFWIEDAELPWKNPVFYAQGLDPNVYVDREYAPLEQRMRAYISWARAVPTAIAQARENLRTPMPRTYLKVGRAIFGGLGGFLEKEVAPIFAPVRDARLQEEFAAANAQAAQAFKDFDAWLQAHEAGATNEYALGAERFLRMLRATERVDVPLARLKEMGERDLERNLASLREVCARFAPGESVRECVAKVQAKKPAEGPVAAAGKQLHELRAFILEKRVVTIPSDELAEVREAPSYRRWNAAYIDVPGPYEKNLPSTYRIAPPDPSWTAAEQAAYIPARSDLLFYSTHEVWPGHFLQHLHSDRSPSLVGRLFHNYSFSEGWAHYAEEMMWEMGLANGDPEVHVSQLTNALLRNVRYLSAIGLQTGGMSVEESEAMFREKAFQDPGNARQQAARGTFDAGYGNYTLGKLIIRKLRDDWTATRGGRAAWHSFHDQLLSHGSPPLPLVRKAMLPGDTSPPI